MFKQIAALAVLATLAAPAAAETQFYGELTGGITQQRDSEGEFNGPIGVGSGTTDFETGFAVSGEIGAFLTESVRAGVELSYRKSDVGNVVSPIGALMVAGSTNSVFGFVNGWYDFDTGTDVTLTVGGGVGIARHRLQIDRLNAIQINASDSDRVFAYQIGVGASFPLTDSLDLTGGYRYVGTTDPEFKQFANKVTGPYSSHNFQGGLRLKF